MGVAAAVDVWQQHVVGHALAPAHAEQRLDGLAGAAAALLGLGATGDGGDLGGIAVEPLPHGRGDVLGVERPPVAVTEHRGHTVVAGHDDIATAGSVIQHIVGGPTITRGGPVVEQGLVGGVQAGCRHTVALDEPGGNLMGLAFTDVSRPGVAHDSKAGEKHNHVDSIHDFTV